jgi:hypothetical protein
VTLTYWLGLSKIAEEKVPAGAVAMVTRPDSESSGSPATNGWAVAQSWGSLGYVTDANRGNVLRLTPDGSGRAAAILGDDKDDALNASSARWNSTHKRIGMWLKSASAGGGATVRVLAETATGKAISMFFAPGVAEPRHEGDRDYFFPLGSARDLAPGGRRRRAAPEAHAEVATPSTGGSVKDGGP